MLLILCSKYSPLFEGRSPFHFTEVVCARRQLQGWGGGGKAGLQEVRELCGATSPQKLSEESPGCQALTLARGCFRLSLQEAGGEFMVGEVPPDGGAVAERFEGTD